MFKYFEFEFSKIDSTIMNFPWEDKAAYAMFLAQVYHFVKNSSRIMTCVACRFDQDRELIHRNLIKHADEEAGHQFLAKKDLENLGYRLEEIPELYTTRQFYEPQYYKAMFHDPIGFYGYALALEGTAVKRGQEIYQRVRKAHGEGASLFWKVHVKDDQDHVGDALKMIDQLSDKEKDAIKDNLSQSVFGLGRMFEEIVAKKALVPKSKKSA